MRTGRLVVLAARGALKGLLPCGANEAVMLTFDEIGTAHKVETWLDAALPNKRKIMGFGHRVYKNGDSRVPTMKAALDTLVAEYNRPDLAQLYDALEAAMTERKGIRPNLGYPSGPAYSLIGFDTKLFTPLFVMARITGWTAHIMEQHESNALIRPLSSCNGPAELRSPEGCWQLARSLARLSAPGFHTPRNRDWPLQPPSCSGVECGDALDDLAKPVAGHSEIREDRCVAVHLCLLTGVGVSERPALHRTKRQWWP